MLAVLLSFASIVLCFGVQYALLESEHEVQALIAPAGYISLHRLQACPPASALQLAGTAWSVL